MRSPAAFNLNTCPLHHATRIHPPVVYIAQQAQVEPCLQELAAAPVISFDLEFDNNRYSYGVTLCLIQVATPTMCYIIDPMEELDLGGLYSIFEDPNIQKLVHSPGEDLRLLHSLGCYPKNVFDTEVVARLLNYEQTSLANMLRVALDHHISKQHQKSNWLRRPLSEGQIQYAAEDVVWLHPLKDLLVAEAETRGLMPLVREEQAMLSTTIHQPPQRTTFLKPADFHSLSPRDQYITNELLRLRDELARDINKPPYQVMNEDLVRALACGQLPPESVIDDPGVHPRYKNSRFANRIAGLLKAARTEANAQALSRELPTREPRSPEQHAASRKASHDKEHLFAPIQQELVKRYGTFATQLLLSNRLVGEILNGNAQLPRHRKVLFREVATQLGLDVSDYLKEV